MLLSEFLEKWGFKLCKTFEGHDGVNEEYSNSGYIIDLYHTEESITSYLLNKDRTHVLDVQPNTNGIFDEWDEYLSNS